MKQETKETKEEKKEEVIKEPETLKETFKETPETPISTELIQSLVDEVKVLKQQNEMLIQVADKKALGTYYSRNQKDLPKILRLNSIDGKVILSWTMVKNEVYKDPMTLRWIEKQDIALTLEDGKVLEMAYPDFVRKYIQEEATVLSKISDEITGKLKLKVARLSDGKEFEVGVEFIN